MMEFKGVRSSWLMLARKRLFSRSSSMSRALASASSWVRSATRRSRSWLSARTSASRACTCSSNPSKPRYRTPISSLRRSRRRTEKSREAEMPSKVPASREIGVEIVLAVTRARPSAMTRPAPSAPAARALLYRMTRRYWSMS